MDEYREKVRRYADERTGEPIFNASPDHAAIIVENVFRTAEREVCIFTRHLAPRIFAHPSVVRWVEIFLADNETHSLRIVLRKGDLTLLETNPLFKAIRHASNVAFRAIDDWVDDSLSSAFLVADGTAYRFEPDRSKCEAVAAFGSENALKLQSNFEKLWQIAQAVNLDKLEVMEMVEAN